MRLLAAGAGVLIGSLPSADALGRLWGVELRSGGSNNPGTNNALKLGGRPLAAAVLATEVAKGAVAVWLGRRLGGDVGGALAAVGATAGNVYNPWFRLRGGKGLAITAGTLLGAWPTALVVLLAVIAGSAARLHRSGPAALLALFTYLAGALVGLAFDLPVGWGLAEPQAHLLMAIGSVAVMVPKHWADTVRPAGRPASPG